MNSDSNKKPDIIIVDDHLIFRQGLKAILNFEEIGSVIGEASDGEEFIELLSTLNPDIVLMDIDMPQMNGFDATIKALQLQPNLKIIAFTVFSEEEYYNKMIAIGAKGFILKSSGFNELESAIHTVMQGDSYFLDPLRTYKEANLHPIDLIKTTVNEISLNTTKEKVLFFPWIFHLKTV